MRTNLTLLAQSYQAIIKSKGDIWSDDWKAVEEETKLLVIII
jgi:hypothetical protein